MKCKDLKPLLGKVKLVDVREPEEHAESNIPGSVLIPLGELRNRAPRELGKEDAIVLFCHAGKRSAEALMELKLLGFKNVNHLEGGILAWKAENPDQ